MGATTWRPWRLAVAVALLIWSAAAVWLLIRLVDAERAFHNTPGHPSHNPFTGVGELLLPAMVLALAALILVLVPRRLAPGWTLVFLTSVAGVFAWLFLRGSAGDLPSTVHDEAALIVWLVLGLIAGLIALSILMLRGQPGLPDVHVAQQFAGSYSDPHMLAPPGSDPLVDRAPPDERAP
jgi:hypothetical protein